MEKYLLNLLKTFQPEIAHYLTIQLLKNFYFLINNENDSPMLKTNLAGNVLVNPIGLAAGFDKNAEVINATERLGFGLIECGTVTPYPQMGNPKPRVFRLKEDRGLINRLGFNSLGIENFQKNFNKKNKTKSLIGINIGPNKDSNNFIKDYLFLFEKTYDHADYITINLSSPNTQGLRDMQKIEALQTLTSELKLMKDEKKEKKNVFIKIDPDSSEKDYENIINIVYKNNIDGLIVTNTSKNRPASLGSKFSSEIGGLSGNPIRDLSNNVLKNIAKKTNGEIALIGVGGISSGKDIYEKIKLGASAVQLYTALTYEGSIVIRRMKRDLIKLLKKDGYSNISEAIGSELD